MDTGEHVRRRIVEHDRHTIRRKNGQRDRRIRGNKRIRLRHRRVDGERAYSSIAAADNPHPRAMHLPAEHEIAKVSANGAGYPPPILQHNPRVIPNGKAQIQRGVGANRSSATPPSNERLKRHPLERGPAQKLKPGDPAQGAGSRAPGGGSING